LATWPHRLLSEEVELFRLDLAHDPLADGSRVLRLPITESATAHGLIAWFQLDLVEGIQLDNGPGNAGSHWMQAYVPFTEPRPVSSGEVVSIDVSWRDLQLSARPLAYQTLEGDAA
jgi:type II protein arginine methyltransferase